MIKSNELRIGNLVLDNQICRKVTGIKLDDLGDCVRLDDITTNRLIKNIDPIPLTPEILESCGFVKTYANSVYARKFSEHSGNSLVINLDTLNGLNIFSILDTYSGEEDVLVLSETSVQYLHQLQNLYFALTGEELTINQLGEDKPVFFKDAFRTPPPHPPKPPV